MIAGLVSAAWNTLFGAGLPEPDCTAGLAELRTRGVVPMRLGITRAGQGGTLALWIESEEERLVFAIPRANALELLDLLADQVMPEDDEVRPLPPRGH